MNLTKRAFIFGLASILSAQNASAAKPTVFDFYEYVQRRKAASETPNEEPWIPGEIRALDRGKRQIRVTHSPAPAFGMPIMTMTLDVVDKVDLKALRIGDQVDIRIGKIDGQIEVIDIRRLRR